MSVSPDHAPVKAHIPCLACRHHGQLCGNKIALNKAVLFIEYVHYVKLDGLTFLVLAEGSAADKHIEQLAIECLCHHL